MRKGPRISSLGQPAEGHMLCRRWQSLLPWTVNRLTDSPFRHAASATLKHILEKESRHITRADLEQALEVDYRIYSATMSSAIAFRPPVLKAQAEAAKNAMGALHRRQN